MSQSIFPDIEEYADFIRGVFNIHGGTTYTALFIGLLICLILTYYILKYWFNASWKRQGV